MAFTWVIDSHHERAATAVVAAFNTIQFACNWLLSVSCRHTALSLSEDTTREPVINCVLLDHSFVRPFLWLSLSLSLSLLINHFVSRPVGGTRIVLSSQSTVKPTGNFFSLNRLTVNHCSVCRLRQFSSLACSLAARCIFPACWARQLLKFKDWRNWIASLREKLPRK